MSPIVTKRFPLKAFGRVGSLTLLAAALVACRSEQTPSAVARPGWCTQRTDRIARASATPADRRPPPGRPGR